jgi:dihydroneopterin aldolase/2-amino-4-hydroxy-6-hydroxymethyldihydropteridine diphosphokinase
MSEPLTIDLRGLKVFAYHGVREHEQRDGQTFLIDLHLVPEGARACETDRLADAISYSEVADHAVKLATERRFDLIERLAAAIGDSLLVRFPLLRVEVTVHKPQAPIAHEFGDVSVTVTRASARRI